MDFVILNGIALLVLWDMWPTRRHSAAHLLWIWPLFVVGMVALLTAVR